jgi:hypothetical protein
MGRVRIGDKAAVIVCAVAAVAAGCRGKASGKRAPGAGTSDAGAGVATGGGPHMRTIAPPDVPAFPPEPPAVMPRELDVTLLEPGKGPRTRLRYRGGGDAERELVARSLITTHAYADGTWLDELTMAPVHDGFGISAVARDAAAGGGLTVHLRALEATVDSAKASPPAVTAAEGYVARWQSVLARRRADVTTDDRGRLRDAILLDDLTGAQSDARDELVQRWLGLVVPLPEEPIAPGARWRVRTILRTGGAVLKQTATYKLVSAGAGGWTVEVEAERIGEAQEILVPGVDSAIGELVALRRMVKGTLTVAPADPLALRGTLTADVSSHARFALGGGRTSERYTDDHATIELGLAP